MTTVTLTAVVSDTMTARLQVDVDGAVPGETMTLTRVDQTRRAVVMGAAGIPAQDRVIVDGETPLNRPVSWEVVTSTGATATTGPATLVAALAVVSDPVTGRRALVAVIDRDQVQLDPRATVLQVEGDPAPWIVRDIPAGRRAPISLYSLDTAAETALDAMLGAGGPLLLRCGCGHHTDLWIEPVATSEREPLVRSAGNLSRRWSLGVCMIYPGNPWPAGTTALGNTLGLIDAAVGHSTLGAIAGRWSTLGEIAVADLGV